MSGDEVVVNPGDDVIVEDDPRYPFKAIAAAIMAGGASLLTYADDLPKWVVIAVAVVLAGLATFVVPNPKRFV